MNNNENSEENFINLGNVYDEEIYGVINQLKEEVNNAREYMNQSNSEFSKLNGKFVDEIISHLKNKALLYENLFNLKNDDIPKSSSIELKLYTKKTIKSLKKMVKVYSQIFESIKQTFNIFFSFLNISKYINSAEPTYDFYLDKFRDIINSWLFMKLDVNKCDFSEALNKLHFEENFKKLILNINKSKLLHLNLVFPIKINPIEDIKDKINKNIKIISENQLSLTELNIQNLKNYENISEKKFKFNKLKKFSIKNVSSKSNINFDQMQKLEKFIMKSCLINPTLLKPLPDNLKKIYLEKNNFTDKDFTFIMNNLLLPNKSLLKNLELLSFAKNNLSKIDISGINSKYIFSSLMELNFSKNKISTFKFNKNNFQKLNYINICYNNLNKSYLGEINNIIGLESANLFLLKNELFNKYYTQLKHKLALNSDKNDEIKFKKISYLNFTYFPKLETEKYFNDFTIKENIILNLKKLDLSYSGLKADIFFKFVEKNKGFLNLRCLNLTGNYFDDIFFEKYLEYKDVFNKLEHLYLNCNFIGDPSIKIDYKDDLPVNDEYLGGNSDLVYKLRLIYKFIEKNHCLTKLSLLNNPISKMYSLKNVYPTKNSNEDKMEDYIKFDENNHIIINCFISLLYKIQIELIKSSDITKIDSNGLKIIFNRE